MNDREEARKLSARLRRDATKNPRGIGVALFAVGLLIYGLAASDGQAIVIALIIAACVFAILVVPAVIAARRAR